MDHFVALLVDDEPRDTLTPVGEYFEKDPGQKLRQAVDGNTVAPWHEQPTRAAVKVCTARNYAEALELLRTQFFHLAMIDARLDREDKDNFEGLSLLGELKNLRPACERVVMSRLFGMWRDAERIVREVHPLPGFARGRAHSLFNLADPAQTCADLIEDRAFRWLRTQVQVVGAQVAVDGLQARARRGSGEAARITHDEVDFLVSRLFGQGEQWNQGDGIGIARVELALIEQGFSSAAVLKGRCFSANQAPGIWCVLKFADRHYIEQELVRYSRYVRYRLAVHHRVELLGCGFGDNLGVLCYNFASASPESAPVSLSKLFLKADRGFFVALDDLLSPGKKGWYQEKGTVRSLGNHFHTTYAVDTIEIRRQLASLHEIGWLQGDRLTIGDVVLELPSADLFVNTVFTGSAESCIVHGDMHCDNILVGAGNYPNLIDYYYVGNGPRAIDFATLEGSVRLLDLQQRIGMDDQVGNGPDPALADIVVMIREEQALEQTVWSGGAAAFGPEQALSNWATASLHIAGLARRNHEGLRREEYAATCIMWAMRLLKVPALSTRQRLRLLVWISPLITLLKAG
jgi:hypothetical protein